jgi:outer membrane protein
MIKYITIISLLFFSISSFGQDIWSLERCIKRAEENSLTIQQSDISLKQAAINLRQNELSRYPSLSAASGINYNIGRSVNPVTNQFVTNNLISNNYSLSSNITIYNGGRIQNSIKKSKIDQAVSKEDLEQSKRNVALEVAQAYLQVLLVLEREKSAKITLRESIQQEDRVKKLIRAGSLPEGDIYEVQAQVARDEQSLISAENSVEQAYLSLKVILQLPIEQDLKIEIPNIPVPPPESIDIQPYQAIVQRAVANQPSVKAGELRMKSSEYAIEIAKANRRPSISLLTNTGTRYSNLSLNDANYFEQLIENLNGGAGLSLNVPIYDKGATASQIELAKLTMQTQEISNKQIRQTIEADVQRAFQDVKAAAKQLQAAEKTTNASQQAFNNTKRRYELGASSLLEFNTSRNNLATAEQNVIIAKYDYIFKLKILDFYQGKKISLK